LPRVVADTPIGKTVNMDVLRKGKKEVLRVTVAKLDDSDGALAPKTNKPAVPVPVKPSSKLSQLGLTLGMLDGDARTKYHLASDIQGAVVTDVDPDSVAAEKALRPGDVIVEVQSQPVRSPDDVAHHIEADSKAGKKVELLLVNRNGDLTFIALRLAEG